VELFEESRVPRAWPRGAAMGDVAAMPHNRAFPLIDNSPYMLGLKENQPQHDA
jgi:hypothetical protein